MKNTRLFAFLLAMTLVISGCTHASDEIHYDRQSGTYIVIKAGDYYLMGDNTFNGQCDIWSNSQYGNVDFTQIPEGFDCEPLMFAEIDAGVVRETGGVDGRMQFHFDEISSFRLLDFEEAMNKIEIPEIPRGCAASACLPQIDRFEGEDEVYIFAPCVDKYCVYIDGELYAEYDTLGQFRDVGVFALCSADMTAENAKALVESGEVQSETFFALNY